MTIWRCVTCKLEGPAEDFPLHWTPSLRAIDGGTVGSTRLVCPNCGGWLKPKTRAEIEADEERRFLAAIEHEIASSHDGASQAQPRANSSDRAAAALGAAAALSPAQQGERP